MADHNLLGLPLQAMAKGEEQRSATSQKARHLSVPTSNPQQPILYSGLKSNLLWRHIAFQLDLKQFPQNH
uniref:Uncharacterized protein n=1 Tax=Medicago truncatula TaxID=3880 RepID=I3SP45_MEDTR|nr:unknown [Medicago truncatula]